MENSVLLGAFGIICLVVGLHTYFFPDVISGYNMLPPEKKERVDIRGLKRITLMFCIAIALLMFAAAFVPNSPTAIIIMTSILVVLIVIYVLLARKKYN